MNRITSQNIDLFNSNLRYESPQEIVAFAMEISNKPVVTTSFGPYSAALLHLCVSSQKDIQVIWCDTGYNTAATYQHARDLTKRLELNLDIFTPKYTTAFLDYNLGRPSLEDPVHQAFSEEVKLKPFRKAFEKHQPDLWFTNLRQSQNEHRRKLDILSVGKQGVLKVSPFFYFSDEDIRDYLKKHHLPVETDYFDPVKAMQQRECGIHLKN